MNFEASAQGLRLHQYVLYSELFVAVLVKLLPRNTLLIAGSYHIRNQEGLQDSHLLEHESPLESNAKLLSLLSLINLESTADGSSMNGSTNPPHPRYRSGSRGRREPKETDLLTDCRADPRLQSGGRE